jgi:hypothetical protein
MANTVTNPVYIPSGPTADKQILATGPGSSQELAYIGTATVTGDSTGSTVTVNYIDGTAALSFTPSAILCVRTGGTSTATVAVASAVDAANSNKTFTLQATATIGTGTFFIVFLVFK